MIVKNGQIQYRSAKSTPVYGSFWRWLFRRPKYYEVSYEFVARPRGEEDLL